MSKWTHGGLPRRGTLPLLACLLAVTAAFAIGCGGSDADSGSTGTVASARRVVQVRRVPQDRWTYARARFNEMCAGCHSLDDAGATGRRYDLDVANEVGVEEQHVRFAIAEGEPGMPAWKEALSGREYEELVAYITTVAKRGGGDSFWEKQLALRGEGEGWTPDDTERLERYARRLAKE